MSWRKQDATGTLLNCSPAELREIIGRYRLREIDLVCEMERLSKERAHFKTALEAIAGVDFRGNRSTESEIAHKALEACRAI